jgi:hypothetical protein
VPKPQRTYLHTQRVAKITHQAGVARERVSSAAARRAALLEDELARRRIDLDAIRRLIALCQSEPATARGRRIKQVSEALEQIDDLADAAA